MKPLVVTSAMTNMNGVFYPTGHVLALFKDQAAVQKMVAALDGAHHHGSVAYADSERIRQQITKTVEGTESILPSSGADNDLVRRIDDLAQRGCHGMLIELSDKDNIETVQSAVQAHGAQAAFYYRTFIIEELVEQPKNLESQSVTGTHSPGAHPDTTASENHPRTEIQRD